MLMPPRPGDDDRGRDAEHAADALLLSFLAPLPEISVTNTPHLSRRRRAVEPLPILRHKALACRNSRAAGDAYMSMPRNAVRSREGRHEDLWHATHFIRLKNTMVSPIINATMTACAVAPISLFARSQIARDATLLAPPLTV